MIRKFETDKISPSTFQLLKHSLLVEKVMGGLNSVDSHKNDVLGGTKIGTWGARIKILRPLFSTNTPPKTPI